MKPLNEFLNEKKKSVDLKAVASYYGMTWFQFTSLSDKKRKEYKERYIKHQEMNEGKQRDMNNMAMYLIDLHKELEAETNPKFIEFIKKDIEKAKKKLKKIKSSINEDVEVLSENRLDENIATDAAMIASDISTGGEPVNALIFAGIMVGIATVASVGAIADVSGYRFSDVKDFFYDLWVKYRIKPIVKRLSKDPEVIELVKSGKPGWQNMLRDKLSKKEQLYVYDIYRKHFKGIK